MKKYFALIMAVVMSLSASSAVFAGTNSGDTTLGELEDEMVEFIKDTYPDIEYGSIEYIEYIQDQLFGEKDENLYEREDYKNLILYANEYIYELNNANAKLSGDEIFSLPEETRKLTVSKIKEISEEEDENDIEYSKNNSSVSLMSTGYNGDDAADYALEYAYLRNPEYDSFTSDCTNFVSQCIYAGGIDMDFPSNVPSGINDTTSYWYSEFAGYNIDVPTYNISTSFINVEDLYDYLTDESLVTVISGSGIDVIQDEAEIGDIVQLKYGSGRYSHSIIITGGTRGNYKYSAHSTNRRNEPISNIDDNEISRVRIIHFE